VKAIPFAALPLTEKLVPAPLRTFRFAPADVLTRYSPAEFPEAEAVVVVVNITETTKAVETIMLIMRFMSSTSISYSIY
jgi:hypothetical protein